MFEVTTSRVGVATQLIPSGSLDSLESVEQLKRAIEAATQKGTTQLVLDLSGVAVVNSHALELLLDTADSLARAGGQLKAANTNVTILDLLRITGIDAAIAVIDEIGAVIKSRDRFEAAGRRIGEILIGQGVVSEELVEQGLALQKDTGERLVEILISKGWLTEREVLPALALQLRVPYVWIRPGVYDPDSVRLLDAEVALRLQVIPLCRVRGMLYLATTDPQAIPSLDEVADLTQSKIKPILASREEILTALSDARGNTDNLSEYIGDLESDLELVQAQVLEDNAIDEMAEGSPVVNLINGLIQRAVVDGASDIHIEPNRATSRIRFRVDGVLYPIMTPPLEIHPALISRLKVMAGLDISERRLPQDGRIQIVTGGRIVDLRFGSLPGIFGEKVVLRLLDKQRAILDINRLGMAEANLDSFRNLLKRSHGLLLVTGPTGSGKTTSLYAGINSLNGPGQNIVTIEDPVEYQIDGVNQNQVREGIGLSFATILKAALRQDPDILLVGEIRERETAEIAVQAALTGHLVLSTLHTNDSIGAVVRMLDMGIEPFLLSSALIGVVGQRLLRGVCSECETSYQASPETLREYGIDVKKTTRLARGRGCSACFDSGYRGRLAIHEIVECDPDLQRLIVSSPSRDQLDAYLKQHGGKSLLDDGIDRALNRKTTLEEAFRVVRS